MTFYLIQLPSTTSENFIATNVLFTKEAYKNVILVLARIRLEIFIYLQEHFAHLFIYVPYPPDKYLDEFYSNFKIHIFFK